MSTSLEGVRAVFFDAVGTLIHPNPSAAVVYADIGRRHGTKLSVNDIASRFKAAFNREEQIDRAAGLRTSEEREVTRWRSIVRFVLDDVSDPETCFQELYTHFAQPGAWKVDPDASAVFSALQQSGYLLGLASNYDHRLRLLAAALPQLGLFQHVIISSEAGARKPAQAFFAAMSRQVDLTPERILHVGDDPINDYQGAIEAGLQAILLDSRRKWSSFSGRRVDTLAEVVPFLRLPV